MVSKCFLPEITKKLIVSAWEIYSGSKNTWRNNVVLNCQMIARIKQGGPKGFQQMLLKHNLFAANRRGFSWEGVTCLADHIHFQKNTFIGGGKIEAEGHGHYRETERVERASWPQDQGVKEVFALLYKLAAVAGPRGNHLDLAEALSGPAARAVRSGGRPPTDEQLHRPLQNYALRTDNVRLQIDFENKPYLVGESLVGLIDPSTKTAWSGVKERPNYTVRSGGTSFAGRTTSGGNFANLLDSSPGGTRGASLPLSGIGHDRPYYLSFWLACDFPESIDSASFGVAPLFSITCSAWEQGGHRMVGMSVSERQSLALYGPLDRWMFLEFEIKPLVSRFRLKIDGVVQHLEGNKTRSEWFSFNTVDDYSLSRRAASLWFHGGKRFVGTLALDDITIGGWPELEKR